MIRPLCLIVILAVVASVNCPAQDWVEVTVPDAFRKVPQKELAPIDGYSWYQCRVQVPATWQGAEIRIHVEALDDARATYVNGIRVGATGTFPPQYRSGLGENGTFLIPAGQLKVGQWNSVSIRVYQSDPRPNFSVAPPVLTNDARKEGIRLAGTWLYRPGDQQPSVEFSARQRERVGYSVVDSFQEVERYVSRREGDADPLSPEEATLAFDVPNDLQVELVLSEPQIAQPLFMSWDASGRLWVMEYRQYPEIAGVNMVSRDVYLRSVYDSIPKPPPHGVPGRDRISIHEDTDGDGIPDQHKTFIDGLNLASSFAIGRGGVFVTNPPYLLFYADSNRDDVPDGDPEVLLEGFGIEDSHSVINSLRFGPDGWLYGCQGSTVTGRVKRPNSSDPPIQTMGQQIWRYHPESRRFEVFAEGGGNTFGCEFDSNGNLFSGHNGGDTRGFHYVQGGYYKKGFGKHGPLSNPYAFGYFQAMAHHSVPRFTHNFVIYEDRYLPAAYQGRLFGIEPLQGQVVMSDIFPDQSSFATKDISRVVKTDDQWFRPVDIKIGPDQCLYLADMYEQRIDHSSHYAGRIDRGSGRIYRLRPRGSSRKATKAEIVDWSSLTSRQLVDSLADAGKTDRQTIQRLLGDRGNSDIIPFILAKLEDARGTTALELFWAAHSCGLEESQLVGLIRHREASVRKWCVRVLGDRSGNTPATASALAELSRVEPSVLVRKQLASTAKRLATKHALPILCELVRHEEDTGDIHQPLLIWWALEAHTTSEGRQKIVDAMVSNHDVWHSKMVRDHLAGRLIKRYALAGSGKELIAVATILNAAESSEEKVSLLGSFEEAYQGRSLVGLPDELVNAISESGGGSIALRLRQGRADAMAEAVQEVLNPKASIEQRVQFVQIFGQVRRPELVDTLLSLATTSANPDIVAAALNSLQAYSEERIGAEIAQAFSQLPKEARSSAEQLLSGRSSWAKSALKVVDEGGIDPSQFSMATVNRMLLHEGTDLKDLIGKHWGAVDLNDAGRWKARVDEIETILQAGTGNPKQGKPLYMKNCGKCHQLFGEGGNVGPDLTPFQRDDTSRMLQSIVNPSLEIREGFETYLVETKNGRLVTGFLAEQDNRFVSLRTVDGQNSMIQRSDIEDMRLSRTSIMPQGTLKELTAQQIRDLFAYLRSSQPVNY